MDNVKSAVGSILACKHRFTHARKRRHDRLCRSGVSVAVKATATGQESQSTAGSSKTSPQRSSGAVARVDLNTANAEELTSVFKGVASSKAKVILLYRT